MADAVVSYVVNRVGNFLLDEAVFLSEVKDQVEWVKDELLAMECFLKDADAKSKGDERVKNWVRNVREIACRAEDLIESFVLDAQRRGRRSEGFVQTALSCVCVPSDSIVLHQFGKEIEAIKTKIRDVNERRITYGIQNLGEEATRKIDDTVWERRRVVLHASDADLEEAVVVSIVGMGGLGKTTLAKRIFNQVRANFSPSLLIVVSREYSVEDLLRDLLRQKYLIMLDDVWDTDVWRILGPHLPDAKNGSRVVITTRSIDVARAADSTTPPHELRFLTEEESWELLSKKAFPNQEDIDAVCSEQLREVGKQIARKCGGLPLALVVIGGLLSTKDPSLKEWRRLAETIVWKDIKDGRLCLDILALSYADLPHHLKCCFLYFSSFPEDFEIYIEKLTRLWIAEGLVERRAGETLEESAEGYLNELVRRCMVTVVQHGNNSWQDCRIHDLLRDFSIAEAKEVGFLVCRRIPEDQEASRPDSTVRRLSLHAGVAEDYVSLVKYTPRVRTLMWFNARRRRVVNFTIPELKLLRVIDLEGHHSPYFQNKWTKIRGLPSSVGNLPHLQCLDVQWTRIERMPRSVWKLEALRHVDVPEEVDLEMVEPGLKNLQVLKVVRAGSWIESCLGTITSLRELELTGLKVDHHDALSSSLPMLSHLKKLRLEGASIPACLWKPSSFASLEVLSLKGQLTKPQQPGSGGVQWPLNLTQLSLSGTKLDQGSISALQSLPELAVLTLYSGSYTGNEMICSRGGFPQLQFLALAALELESLVVEAGAMSRLRSLKIYGCKKLVMLPEGLQYMTALKHLALHFMPPDFCSRVREDGEDWPKIRHIPSIYIPDP
ncbi:unnamed protein product [Spirodela intermedia]|uniref:Uncharacterized protein n=1 Tax=Spirodela intermedia TaxID=51605 RepID=A0A7I8JKW5_SPIIN|nr:unnamed protein product [Spirodela intermedia]CAA6670778.1 unnamed protein product [Spirodela intermedia]